MIKDKTNVTQIRLYPADSARFHDSSSEKREYADLSIENEWQTIGSTFKTLPEQEMTKSRLIAMIYQENDNYPAGASIDIKNLALYKITKADYDKYSVEELIDKHPYVEDKAYKLNNLLSPYIKLEDNDNNGILDGYNASNDVTGEFDGLVQTMVSKGGGDVPRLQLSLSNQLLSLIPITWLLVS